MQDNNVRNTWVILLASVVLTLFGCSSKVAKDNKIDYKSSSKGKSLEVPPDLTRPGKDDTMSVPNTGGTSNATYSEYNNAQRTKSARSSDHVLVEPEKIRFERRGDKFWLVMKSGPDQVWTNIREFWVEQGFVLAVDNPSIGIMETDWAENRATIPRGAIRKVIGKVFDGAYSSGTLDRFRVRMEQGQETGTTEIYLSHKGMAEELQGDHSSPSGTAWKPRKRDEELEIEMLKRIMLHIGVDRARAKTLLAGKTSEKKILARVASDEQGTYLVIPEEFSRAWRTVGLALDRTGFTVEDRDRSKGVYFVRYNDPETTTKSKKKFLFWKAKPSKASTQVYEVRVTTQAATTEVRVRPKNPAESDATTVKRVLSLLQENLK